MKKIVVASDSFKGSLSSQEVADAVERAFARMSHPYQVVKIIMSDGGEGFSEAVKKNTDARIIPFNTVNPLKDNIISDYLITKSNDTAVIELAKASGLNLISRGRQNPLLTTTLGSGFMLADAIGRGCKNILIGIGGSATNDAGIGILSALGYRFLDSDKKEIEPIGANLRIIDEIDDSGVDMDVLGVKYTVACDVENSFYGKEGAAFVYAPQKGASCEDILILDEGLRHFCDVVLKKYGKDMQTVSGAGAAGGVAGTLWAVLGAKLVSGSSLMLDMCGFDDIITDASAVITGEGRADSQTLRGKVPFGVLKMCASKVPVFLIAGSVENYAELKAAGFSNVFSIMSHGVSLEMAMCPDFAKEKIEGLLFRICSNL